MIPDDALDVLDAFTLVESDDEVKRDLELTCDVCLDVVCDAEHGDTLATLARTALAHLDTCQASPLV